MSAFRTALIATSSIALALFTTSCGKSRHDHAHDHGPAKATASSSHGHEHVAPHGGTPVVLGDEAYHLELVLDAKRSVLQAFVLDGHMENFIRCSAPSFEVTVRVDDQTLPLVFTAIPDPSTGEKVGDTALFEATADWLTTTQFEGTVRSLAIRGTVFTDVKFHFPQDTNVH